MMIGVVIAVGTIIRLWLALVTDGTNDVTTWLAFADAAGQMGALDLYEVQQWPGVPLFDFNHGPLTAWILKAAAPLLIDNPAAATWIRVPSIIADAASALMAVVLVRRANRPDRRVLAASIVALNPVLILVSGFHGNTDSVFVALTLLASVWLGRNQPHLAGLAFAAAVGIKVVPLLVLPVFFMSIGRVADRRRFAGWFVAASAALWIPPFILSTEAVVREVFLYRGPHGWIPHRILDGLGVLDAVPWFQDAWLAGVFSLVLGVALRVRTDPVMSREFASGLAFLVFLVLATGFGVQYLAWPVVFLAISAPRLAIVTSTVSGVFMYASYALWSGGGFAIGHADLWSADPLWTPVTIGLMQATWTVLAGAAWLMWRAGVRRSESGSRRRSAAGRSLELTS